ncbi:rhodanese-like domain-containing protein [Viridibacterium curvum]|uniref:Rhodanese-like domain-containing protein n=1 Tax=Viridibacterium curvum TaxID=1101404 RepID=A0ABP9Q6R4_9RHOO
MSNAALQSVPLSRGAPLADAAPLSAGAIAILDRARQQAAEAALGYAGGISPQDAWTLFSNGHAVLLDVRTAEERKFVGYVPDSLHVAWATGTSMTRNPRFVREVEAKLGKDRVVLLLCRSGKRSVDAAEALTKAGYTQAFNVLEGFEGDLDAQQRRGALGGWRHHGLPWLQD